MLAGLEASAVTDVHVFGRRGPADIKFTPIELRELGEVPDVDIVVHDEDFAHLEGVTPANNQLKVMLRMLEGWRTRESTGASRRLHLHFYHAPLEVLGADRVEGLRFERTEPTGDGGVRGTGEFREYPVQQVYRAVGYYGTPVVDAPFDDARGRDPERRGTGHGCHDSTDAGSPASTRPAGSSAARSASSATRSPTRWRRSPTSSPTRPQGRLTAPAVDGDVLELLDEREVAYTTWDGWLALDAHERELGAATATRASASRSSRATSRSRSRARSADRHMTYVIALPCVDVKDRACIDECPVDCIYEGDRSLYIHPDECVDCGACEPVCPVEAIYYEDDLPDEWQDYYKANVEFFDDIGSPGGAAKVGVIRKDHPVIAALPPQGRRS